MRPLGMVYEQSIWMGSAGDTKHLTPKSALVEANPSSSIEFAINRSIQLLSLVSYQTI